MAWCAASGRGRNREGRQPEHRLRGGKGVPWREQTDERIRSDSFAGRERGRTSACASKERVGGARREPEHRGHGARAEGTEALAVRFLLGAIGTSVLRKSTARIGCATQIEAGLGPRGFL